MISTLLLVTVLSIPDDKLAHAGVSMGLTVGSYAVCRTLLDGPKTTCQVASALATMGLGVVKEVVDGNKNTKKEHVKDLAADAVGVGLGLVFTIPF